MPLDLTSVRAKLARSAEHAQTIRNEVGSWMNRNPYSLIKKRNPECTRFSLILRINEVPTWVRWSLMFGDYLSNLRSALDHLVYAIACHEAASSSPPYEDKLAYPLTDSEDRFDDFVSRKKLGDISAPVRAAIQRFQPYTRPHDKLPPLLALIRDLNNGDKHKLLRVVYGTPYQANVGFAGVQPPGATIMPVPPHVGEIEDGTEVFAMTSDVPAPEMDYDRHIIDVVVAIRHDKRDPNGPPWTDRTDILSLMNALSAEVRQVIYDVSGKVV